jgi:hypothetical protein
MSAGRQHISYIFTLTMVSYRGNQTVSLIQAIYRDANESLGDAAKMVEAMPRRWGGIHGATGLRVKNPFGSWSIGR